MLEPLFKELRYLKGAGPITSLLFKKLTHSFEEPKLIDILCLKPAQIIHYHICKALQDASIGTYIMVCAHIEQHKKPKNPKQPYKIIAKDQYFEPLQLVFFHGSETYLRKKLPVASQLWVMGKLELFQGIYQINHPGVINSEIPPQNNEIIYPLTNGLKQSMVRKWVGYALAQMPDLPEWIDANLLKQKEWPAWRAAFIALHNPKTAEDIGGNTLFCQRLAYDEILAEQLGMSLVRSHYQKRVGLPITRKIHLVKTVLAHLPFELTNAQKTAMKEIMQDITTPTQMLRLLQGDVGSGKTLVALLSMLVVVENGYQAALMAPTDLLARQHYYNIMRACEGLNIHIALLTGQEKGKKRERILQSLREGNIDIIIGTHALFQESVTYKQLAFIVIDEQHRFGVNQRLMLAEKGYGVHTLVMTATPIPRTLLLVNYGDIDVSILREKPKNRQDITTKVLPVSRIDEIVLALKRALNNGQKIYWVCPLVEESDTLSLKAAEERFQQLKQIFGAQVGLVHGKMKAKEKNTIMDAFAAPFSSQKEGINILVATTVIEVGVDVPHASIMVIEHAERFGLSQLHQLRGRVGRGASASHCLLLYDKLGETSKARLEIMRNSNDGFYIAEEDLKLRGFGELLGVKQSGYKQYHFFDVEHHLPLCEMARRQAQLVLSRDPHLHSEQGQALRVLLQLYRKDIKLKTIFSG